MYTAIFQLVQYFEKKSRESMQQSFNVLGGTKVRPLISVIKKRYLILLRSAYRRLENSTIFFGRQNYFARLEAIIKPAVDPLFKVFYSIRIHSERKALATTNFVHTI